MHSVDRIATSMDYVVPLLIAAVYILIFSKLTHETRLRVSAILAGGFSTIYANGGFGGWEIVYMVVASVPAYFAQRSYTANGIVWLMHAGWDAVHHYYGNTLYHWDPMSSFGCMIMDPVVAVWYFAGCPSVFERFGATRRPAAA